MTITDTPIAEINSIESITAEFDIWRDGDESDADFALRAITSLRDSVDELEVYIQRLIAIASRTS